MRVVSKISEKENVDNLLLVIALNVLSCRVDTDSIYLNNKKPEKLSIVVTYTAATIRPHSAYILQ